MADIKSVSNSVHFKQREWAPHTLPDDAHPARTFPPRALSFSYGELLTCHPQGESTLPRLHLLVLQTLKYHPPPHPVLEKTYWPLDMQIYCFPHYKACPGFSGCANFFYLHMFIWDTRYRLLIKSLCFQRSHPTPSFQGSQFPILPAYVKTHDHTICWDTAVRRSQLHLIPDWLLHASLTKAHDQVNVLQIMIISCQDFKKHFQIIKTMNDKPRMPRVQCY